MQALTAKFERSDANGRSDLLMRPSFESVQAPQSGPALYLSGGG